MTTVKQLLKTKGAEVWTTTPDASVYDALKLMADKNVGALLVLEAGRLVGIISERDYARITILKENFSMTTPVSEIMTRHEKSNQVWLLFCFNKVWLANYYDKNSPICSAIRSTSIGLVM
jgi:CBS domain-containing protein